MDKPEWLPEMISVSGVWEDLLRKLYDIFYRDFNMMERVKLGGIPVWWDRRILKGDIYEEGFWHLVSRKEDAAGDRLFDPRRAERLPWCRPVLEHSNDSAVKLWDYKEGRHKRTYVWLEHQDYVIVLEKRHQRVGEVAFLITAFHVDGPGQRASLQKKLMKRLP